MSDLPAIIDKNLPTGMEDLPEDSFQVPRIRIDKDTGKIENLITMEAKESADIILCRVSMCRVLWKLRGERHNPAQTQPCCRSVNGLEPFEDFFFSGMSFCGWDRPPSDICARKVGRGLEFVCPHAVTKNESGDWQRPACDDQRMFAGFEIETGAPFMMYIGGMGMVAKTSAPGKLTQRQYISAIAARRQSLFLFRTTLSSVKVSSQEGMQAFIPVFSPPHLMDNDELPRHVGTIQGLMGIKPEAYHHMEMEPEEV